MIAATDVDELDEVVVGELKFSLVDFVDGHLDTSVKCHDVVDRHRVVWLDQRQHRQMTAVTAHLRAMSTKEAQLSQRDRAPGKYKNLAMANRSRVSCAHNSTRASP